MTPGTVRCGTCPWTVSVLPDRWVRELLAHRGQKHHDTPSTSGTQRDSRYDGESKTAPAGNRGLTPSDATGKG